MQRSLQVGKADVGINDQAFHLMEHWGVGLIVVVTIDATWRNNADRRLLVSHGANLHA